MRLTIHKDKFRVDWFRSSYKGVVFDSDIELQMVHRVFIMFQPLFFFFLIGVSPGQRYN